jgi:hypothetical protein
MPARNDFVRWRWEWPALAVIAPIGVALRVARLDLGWFGVDQARDIAIALDIVGGGPWPTIGPTMRRVTRLGALYHYFWALPYLVSHDPIAGYVFAACLSTAALVLTWLVARRLWGGAAGVVTAAVAAAHPVWVIDGRICWAPAALPFVAILLVWLLLGNRPDGTSAPGGARVVLIGAVLGLAVQLHITMAGWVVGVGLLLLLDRLPLRALGAGALAAAIVGAPALWAMIAPTETGESGLAALPGRGPLAPLAPRLVAIGTLPARVLVGLGDWGGGRGPRTLVAAATGVLLVLVVGGLVRLLIATVRGDRAARTVLIPAAVTALLVLGLPGDAWYYYLDSVLPLWALAAGAFVGTASSSPGSGLREVRAAERSPGVGRRVAVWGALAAALILAGGTARWLRRVAIAQYIPVDPVWLTLDGRPGRDAPSPGRIVTLAGKRRVGALAAALGGDVAEVWRRLHGPAFADATGDNGFWVRFALDGVGHDAAASGSAAHDGGGAHLAFWYADDPVAVALTALPATPRIDVARAGPLVAVTYRPRLDYASCQGDGRAVTVPIRVVPDPRRYGDGTPELPAELPQHVTCRLRDEVAEAGEDEQRLTASLGGNGTVRLSTDTREGVAGHESSLCVPLHGVAAVRLDVERNPDARADLDLYDVPAGTGCERTATPAPER